MAPAAVIFDCDGTLVDSEPLARRAWDESLAPHGYAIDDAEYATLVGRSFESVHAFFAARIDSLPGAAPLWERYSAALFALFDAELEPFPDALETVRALRAQGVAIAVASSSPRERLDRALTRTGFSGVFAASIAGDEVARGKPAPDLFLAAAAALAVAPARCVVVEDAPAGVEAALAAGMRTVGIARPPAPAAGLAGAHAVLARLSADAVLAA